MAGSDWVALPGRQHHTVVEMELRNTPGEPRPAAALWDRLRVAAVGAHVVARNPADLATYRDLLRPAFDAAETATAARYALRHRHLPADLVAAAAATDLHAAARHPNCPDDIALQAVATGAVRLAGNASGRVIAAAARAKDRATREHLALNQNAPLQLRLRTGVIGEKRVERLLGQKVSAADALAIAQRTDLGTKAMDRLAELAHHGVRDEIRAILHAHVRWNERQAAALAHTGSIRQLINNPHFTPAWLAAVPLTIPLTYHPELAGQLCRMLEPRRILADLPGKADSSPHLVAWAASTDANLDRALAAAQPALYRAVRQASVRDLARWPHVPRELAQLTENEWEAVVNLAGTFTGTAEQLAELARRIAA